MRQILQDIKSGTITVADVPVPAARAGHLVIETRASLISAGTERMLLEFGRAGWIEKIKQQPEKVRQVLEKMRTDGVFSTLEAVRAKLEEPMPLGYSNVGIVRKVGQGIYGFAVGDRVVSNGPHAEIVCVPENLCAKVPDRVDDTSAAFTVVGAIALQGVRLINPTIGESVAVIGLGLIGQLACQILKANGCRVIGFNPDTKKVELARALGVEAYALGDRFDPVAAALAFSGGEGVDAVLITASTESNEPIAQAVQMCRKRGRVVLTGVTGLELNRDLFYKKELTFQVSGSYGPGRHDANYEKKGLDYPIGYVRWTAQRNFEAVLGLMAEGKLNVAPLVSARFPIENAQEAYERLLNDRGALGIVLEYPGSLDATKNVITLNPSLPPLPKGEGDRRSGEGGVPVVGFIGAGNFARRTLIPAFKKSGARLKIVVSSGGVSGMVAGKKYGFEQAGSDARSLLDDGEINIVVISTPHSSHARFVIDALRAGKHVFVEKPLCLTRDELAEIQRVYEKEAQPKGLLLMVGFNRRFAPLTMNMRKVLTHCPGPKSIIITVNAGAIPSDHWTQDPEVGGGRIIGEACHFIDLGRYLIGSQIVSVATQVMDDGDRTKAIPDTTAISLKFKDGSIATVHYFANGSKKFPKERIEVFSGGRIFQLDNFRKLREYGKWRVQTERRWRQDKGHTVCVAAFVRAVREGGAPPISFDEIVEVTAATLKATGI